MQRCLDLAEKGLAEAAPNPSVGAVLVYNGTIIGEGATSPFGGSHAEVNCIHSVTKENEVFISKATLFVSLEPCSHYGKTPPCCNLILEKEIPEIYVACSDPNPLVAGKGITQLKEAGRIVHLGMLEKEALDLNKRFFTFQVKKRPYIILKWAQTKKAFFAPNNQEQFWITNKKTKALVHSWRSQEMGIFVGENTVLIDNPRLNTRLVQGKNPIRIILNTNKKLHSGLNVLDQQTPTIIYNFKQESCSKNLNYILLNPEENVLEQILNNLYKLNVSSIIIEGGAFTLKQFIAQNLWDEARVLVGEKELHEGVLAPKLEGELVEHYLIEKDVINIYKNKT